MPRFLKKYMVTTSIEGEVDLGELLSLEDQDDVFDLFIDAIASYEGSDADELFTDLIKKLFNDIGVDNIGSIMRNLISYYATNNNKLFNDNPNWLIPEDIIKNAAAKLIQEKLLS